MHQRRYRLFVFGEGRLFEEDDYSGRDDSFCPRVVGVGILIAVCVDHISRSVCRFVSMYRRMFLFL